MPSNQTQKTQIINKINKIENNTTTHYILYYYTHCSSRLQKKKTEKSNVEKNGIEIESLTSKRLGFRCATRRRWTTHPSPTIRTGSDPRCTRCLSNIPATPRTSPIAAVVVPTASSPPPPPSRSPSSSSLFPSCFLLSADHRSSPSPPHRLAGKSPPLCFPARKSPVLCSLSLSSPFNFIPFLFLLPLPFFSIYIQRNKVMWSVNHFFLSFFYYWKKKQRNKRQW